MSAKNSGPEPGQTLYLDCFSGIAGDMFAGAMLDMGVGSLAMLEEELRRLPVDGWSLSLEATTVSGIAASRFKVELDEAEQEPRSLAAIEQLIADSRLAESVRSHCLAIFGRVARAEAQAHRESLDAVHFHEVGMVDSIIDIVSTCILIEQLSPREIICSPIALGSGTVPTRHGPLPVPAPATAILLKGVPVFQGDEMMELATPTGAALASYFADSFGSLPPMRMDRIGYGAGSHATRGPNLLRCISGERVGAAAGEAAGEQMMMETNIDDSSPEQLAYLAERLLAAGATDVWLTPVIMKKGRPGTVLSLLCAPGEEQRYLDLIFTDSSTFGVRFGRLGRFCLQRRLERVETPLGSVRVKIGSWREKVVSVSPEYEDCRRVAAEREVSLIEVYEAARLAARELYPR
ncbi:MAG: nickel pincer cofactor biosynthesis protein LarC [Thermoleophilia bacterium]